MMAMAAAVQAVLNTPFLGIEVEDLMVCMVCG